MHSHCPKFFVFAGNNGSGKSTFLNLIIDNSKDDGEIVLEVNEGHITFQSDRLPEWAIPIREKFN